MDQFWSLFLKAIVILILLDLVWIGVVNRKNYSDTIVAVQGNSVNLRYGSAMIVYIAMTLIIVIWIIPRVNQVTKSRGDLLMNSYKYGGLLGGLTFMVFNFTNNAMFTNWSLHTSVVDSLWGAFAMGTATYLTAM